MSDGRDLRFEWDAAKDAANQSKHRVAFKEAATVFLDDHARLSADPDHSVAEDRFVLLGLSVRFRLLVVCHCHRENETVIRIISARKANRREHSIYQRYRRRRQR